VPSMLLKGLGLPPSDTGRYQGACDFAVARRRILPHNPSAVLNQVRHAVRVRRHKACAECGQITFERRYACRQAQRLRLFRGSVGAVTPAVRHQRRRHQVRRKRQQSAAAAVAHEMRIGASPKPCKFARSGSVGNRDQVREIPQRATAVAVITPPRNRLPIPPKSISASDKIRPGPLNRHCIAARFRR